MKCMQSTASRWVMVSSFALVASFGCGRSGAGLGGGSDVSGSGSSGTSGSKPGTGTGTGSGAGGGTATGGTATGGGAALPVMVSGSTGVMSAPRLPGGGVVSNTPLAAGCTPESANECPTQSGACASAAGATVTVTKYGTLCLYGDSSSLTLPATTIEYIQETVNGRSYWRFRITFNPGFVDNTYGTGAVGWPPKRGHTFADLYRSDHTELQLFDATGMLAMHFKVDFVSPDPKKPCGYGTLGVKGGDGSMIVGNAAHVLAVTTSSDRALNACGYCTSPACGGSCTANSPATDANYTPNPLTPNWDYRVQYEIWIASEAFGSPGFGSANISYVHASPAKTPQDTIQVSPSACPPNWDTPYKPGTPADAMPPPGGGGTCPAGYYEYVTSEGAVCLPVGTPPPGSGTGGSGGTNPPTGSPPGGGTSGRCPANYVEYLTSEGSVCVPVPAPTPTSGGGQSCPVDWQLYLTTEGAICVPTPKRNPDGSQSCPVNWELYLTSEGAAACVPTPKPDGDGRPSCPINWEVYLTSEGAACLPTPKNGQCPAGYKPDLASEGKYCI
jgi:hypothetical protein